LKAKGDEKPLGASWVSKFLRRHPDLKSKYIFMRDSKRMRAQNPENFKDWTKLYVEKKEKYDIHDEDTYNADEKGE
jgi:hypothetical protein